MCSLYASADPPSIGTAVCVEATDDYSLFRFEVVEDAIREASEQRTADWRVNDGRTPRELLKLMDDCFEAREEIYAKLGRALRVPGKHLPHVRLSLGREANPHSRPSKRARTSSQGEAASGSSW